MNGMCPVLPEVRGNPAAKTCTNLLQCYAVVATAAVTRERGGAVRMNVHGVVGILGCLNISGLWSWGYYEIHTTCGDLREKIQAGDV